MMISNCAVVERTVTGCGRKFKAPEVKQKSFELKRKEKEFSRRPQKGTNRLFSFAFEGKIEQRIQILARKRPRATGLLK